MNKRSELLLIMNPKRLIKAPKIRLIKIIIVFLHKLKQTYHEHIQKISRSKKGDW